MTKEELAGILNGVQMGKEDADEILMAKAKQSGLVIVFGYSDDNVEFAGAFNEEFSAFGGTTLLLRKRGVYEKKHTCDCAHCGHKEAIASAATLKAQWCKTKDYSWTFETKIPHAAFDVLEDEEKFCRGLVFSVNDLP